MLLQGGMLLLVVVGFFFSFCFLLFGFSSAYVQQRSPVPAATTPQPTPHESRLHGQLLSHSLSPCCWGTGTSRQPLQTQHHQLLGHHCQSWADVFLGVQAETWHLSYTCVQTPLGLYLAQGLRQLYRYYVCTILTDCLCCLCFPEPGVVFECSAVSLWFLFLLFLLQLLLQFRETIHLGLSINPVTLLLIGVVAPWLLISPVPALIPDISPKAPKPIQACTHTAQLASPRWKNTRRFLLTCLQLNRVLRSTSDNQKFSLTQERRLCSECKIWQRSPEKTTDFK